MTVYMCKVEDGYKHDWVDLGVFSTETKALEAGGLYIVNHAYGNAHLLDWYEELPILTYWYQDDHYYDFTRVVTECELDKALV